MVAMLESWRSPRAMILNRLIITNCPGIAGLWRYLELLYSSFCSSAPQTPLWSSSTIEFVEQEVLFGTQLCSSSRNELFPCNWSIMPLIEIAFDIF